MEFIWIPIAIAGAFMQAVRTAAQKDLNQKLSIMVTTYVRSLFGLPVLLLFLLWVMMRGQEVSPIPGFSVIFLANTLALALSQLAATWLLIYLFSLRNFTVGTTLTKTDVMMTAVIGSLFFSETINLYGWIAITLTLSGVIILTIARVGLRGVIGADGGGLAAVTSKSTRIGLASGFFFSLSYLFVRQSSLSLEYGDFLYRAGWTVVVATSMQVVILGAWLLWREPKGLLQMFPQWRLCLFIGLTSALGSIAWYTSMTLVNASYVKAVGQIETVFTIIIATIYFREKVSRMELVGIATIIGGVFVFLL